MIATRITAIGVTVQNAPTSNHKVRPVQRTHNAHRATVWTVTVVTAVAVAHVKVVRILPQGGATELVPM